MVSVLIIGANPVDGGQGPPLSLSAPRLNPPKQRAPP
jgi:hypothetical protein